MGGRFHEGEGEKWATEQSSLVLTDFQAVSENGVQVEPIERNPDSYPDLQPWLATFVDRGDIVDVSDPLFPEPFQLKKGQLEHELWQQPAVKRLLYVDQFGWRHAVAAIVGVHPHTRGEHSLATERLIIEKLDDQNRETPELLKVAALTHDIGQPAFSHHGEAAFDHSKSQNWHDHRRRHLLDEPAPYGLADFLERRGIDPNELMAEYENPLLDVERPDLCADRIEYLLRDGMACGELKPEEARALREDVEITFPEAEPEAFVPLAIENHLSSDDLEDLRRLREDKRPVWTCTLAAGETFYRLMERLNGVYTGSEMGTIKMYTSELLRLGMDRGYVNPELVQTGTDDIVMSELTDALRANPGDEEFQQKFSYLVQLGVARPEPEIEAFILEQRQKVEEFQTPDIATTKQRWVDPYVVRSVKVTERTNVPIVRRLSYFKREGYKVVGDNGASGLIKAAAVRLRPQQPEHMPIKPELRARPKELGALGGELPLE